MNQCRALAEALSRTRLSGIHSSDLLRAKMTATVIQEKQPVPKISLRISSLLREQNFGAGEGKKICAKEQDLSLSAHYARGKFPAIYSRTGKFPGGESLEDMAIRVDGVIDEVLFPYVWQEFEGGAPMMVAIVSHGLFIAELVARLVKRGNKNLDGVEARNLRGLKNTAFTKVQVTFKKVDSSTNGSRVSPSLVVKILAINQCSHLANIPRQGGGIGSMVHDPRQRDIQSFFNKQVGRHTKDSKSDRKPQNRLRYQS